MSSKSKNNTRSTTVIELEKSTQIVEESNNLKKYISSNEYIFINDLLI